MLVSQAAAGGGFEWVEQASPAPSNVHFINYGTTLGTPRQDAAGNPYPVGDLVIWSGSGGNPTQAATVDIVARTDQVTP
jgi:hypothetical protein